MSTFTNAKKVPGGYEVLVPDNPNNPMGTYSRKFIPDDQVNVTSSTTKPLGMGATETTYNINVDTTPTTTTSSEPTTASPQPSGDASSPTMLTESRTQTQARESVTDDTTLYEQRVNNLRDEFRKQYDVLEASGFSYVNPSDVNYIIEEQAKEFAKGGLDSIDDLGKRTVKTGVTDVEVDKVTDANGNVRYEYTTGGMIGFGGGQPKTIRVNPSTVKEVMTNMSGNFGNPQPVYIATLPDTMDELFNKKTGETVDVFAGGGTLSGDPDEPTTFGNLYSGVEGGAALNVKFAGDTPVFYPLYQDTSDRDLITPAVLASSIALSAFPGFSESIGTFFPGVAEGSVAAKAIGNAVIAGGTGLAIGKDVEDALLASLITYGTTYGVDALKSGNFGDFLVDNNILEAETVDTLKIPRGASTDLSGLGEGVTTDLLSRTEEIYPAPGGFTQVADATPSLADPQFGSLGLDVPSLGQSTTFADVLAGEGGAGLASDLPLLTSGAVGTDAVTGGLTITDAASATKAVDDVLKLGVTGAVGAEVIEEVVDEASKFIDLKEVFGEDVGGFLEGAVGTGIDFAKLEEIRKRLEGRGEDIAEEFAGLFKPYTVRSGLGVSEITPEGATATADVAYQPIREAQLGAATSLFEGLPATREEATAQQLEATRALTEPQRQREQERMLGTLAQRGLLGYGQTMPTVGGQRRVSPLAESILSAQELARSKEALDAQTFGLTEAGRQRQLAQGLLTGAQTIDKQALDQLGRAQSIAYSLGQVPAREGLRTKSQFEQLGAQAEIAGLTELGDFGKGLFGLETDPGNVPIGGERKYSANEVRKLLETLGIPV